MTAREKVQNQIVEFLSGDSRFNDRGVETGFTPFGKGKARTIYWGINRTLDSVITIYQTNKIVVTGEGPHDWLFTGEYDSAEDLIYHFEEATCDWKADATKDESIESKIQRLEEELLRLKAEKNKSVLVFEAENNVWFTPQRDDSCASLAINSYGIDPDDEESAEYSTYNYVNFECKGHLKTLIDNLQSCYENW